MDQAQHGLFSNRGCIQRTSIWVPGGAISHFGLFRIRMLLGRNGYDKVRRFYFFRHFFILHFSNYLNVFSLIVTSIMTLCIPKIIIKLFFNFFCIIYIIMSGKNINFDDKKFRKSTFYKNKTINDIENIDVNNILVSKKEP